MEIQKLTEWNPWWENKESINDLIGIHREGYDFLLDSIGIKEITIIIGIRRAGKSTLMYQMINALLKKGVDAKTILYINLEDKSLTSNSLEDIYNSYRENLNPDKKSYIFLDEIHKKEGWETFLRKKYDLKSNDKFVISGSCSYLLKKEYATLLTGRNVTFEVFPLSFREFLSFNKISFDYQNLSKRFISDKNKIIILNKIKEYLKIGGFPEVILKEKEFKLKLLKQYFDDILYKDIISRYNLNAQIANDFALYLITNFTSIISLRNLRGVQKISYDTIKNYLSYFKEAFLFFTIDFFSYSLKEQRTEPLKIYCIDNGLRNAVSFKFSEDIGKLAENLVFLMLRKNEKNVYYWKNKKQKEVDFIVKNPNQDIEAINVCYSDEISEREFEGLLEFKKDFPKTKRLLIITKNVEKKKKVSKKEITLIPLWKWLLEK